MNRAMPFLAAAASASRRLGHDYIGTEHVLLAIAEDHESAPARALADRGLSADYIRAEIITLIGICENPPRGLDSEALATLGIDLNEVRRQAEHAFGPGALERTWAGCTPIAPRLKKALELAARDAGESAMTPTHVLLGLASVEDCLAARILGWQAITVNELRAALGHEPPDQQTA